MLCSSSLQILNMPPLTKLNSIFGHIPSKSTYKTLCFAFTEFIRQTRTKKRLLDTITVCLTAGQDKDKEKKKTVTSLPMIFPFLFCMF